MCKLSPIPPRSDQKHGWEYLDHLLQANFTGDAFNSNRSATIALESYSMSPDEIMDAARDAGYKVELTSDNKHLRFTE